MLFRSCLSSYSLPPSLCSSCLSSYSLPPSARHFSAPPLHLPFLPLLQALRLGCHDGHLAGAAGAAWAPVPGLFLAGGLAVGVSVTSLRTLCSCARRRVMATTPSGLSPRPRRMPARGGRPINGPHGHPADTRATAQPEGGQAFLQPSLSARPRPALRGPAAVLVPQAWLAGALRTRTGDFREPA